MQIRPTTGWAWRIALSALLTLVLAVAPLAAQIVMSSHVHAAEPASPGGLVHIHHHDAGTTPHHSHASHDHGALASHHHHPDGVPQPVQHDDGSGFCCGTFCHSACVMMSVLQVRHPVVRPSFERQLFQRFAAVDPDQLQRPPSVHLSL